MSAYNRYNDYKKKFKDSQIYFAVCELPTLLCIALMGFIIEFVIELPFMLICILDHQLGKRHRDNHTVLSTGKR